MFEKIRNILSKKTDFVHEKAINLEELPAWLDERERSCIARRNDAFKISRERFIKFEQDLHQLLTEFGEETSDEPHHHKVEQVNRHALPQFCKKVEAELEGVYSDDDEEFYLEVAGQIDGCFKAFKGPGRYLHILYQDEIKAFRQILDQMGHELNRMTEIVRLSREFLSNIAQIRDLLDERDAMVEEYERAGDEKGKFELTLSNLSTGQKKLESDLATLTSSEEYYGYMDLDKEIHQAEEQLNLLNESIESQIRIAIPVWKRAAKIFQEKGDDASEKELEDMVHIASSPRRQNEELVQKVISSSQRLFTLFDSGLLQAKNSFEKNLFTTSEEYSAKFSHAFLSIKTISVDKDKKKKERDNNPIAEKKSGLIHQIEHGEQNILHVKEEENKRIERFSSMEENIALSLKTIKVKFDEFTKDGTKLIIPGEKE